MHNIYNDLKNEINRLKSHFRSQCKHYFSINVISEIRCTSHLLLKLKYALVH